MKVELRDIETIRPYEKNPRINDQAVDAVANSLREFGFRQPIVVDSDGVIVVGHTRWKAARALGLKQVPIHVAADLTPTQAKAYRLADNQTATLSAWDETLLPQELRELAAMNYDLPSLGWSDGELAAILGPAAGQTDPDAVPDVLVEAVSKRGDLWLMGGHRLLCGDSTCKEDVARVMGGERATMLFTDPPWNVAIGGDANPRHRQRPGLKNDDLSSAQYQAFLESWIVLIPAIVRGDVYCILGASEWPRLDAILRRCGFHWSATVIWVKDLFVLGRSKYHRRYEPLWYGWHTKGESSFCDRRDLDDVWEIPRPRVSDDHPTMKPVQLVVRAITASSRAAEIVFDPFLGSGTTMIAAEQLGRRCFGIEIEPRYVDVAVARWEKFTGKKAVLDTTSPVAAPVAVSE